VTLGEVPAPDLREALTGPGLVLQLGPFSVRLTSQFDSLRRYLSSHYGAFPVLTQTGAHFSMEVQPAPGLRRYFRPQAQFSVNGRAPFSKVPARLAHGLFEWGFNWCVGTISHQWLVVHSAVVEKDGVAALLPAAPGSGKSTLCAALAFSGWRLMSDEFALIDPASGELIALPRPISLKGASIDVMGSRVPALRFSPVLTDFDATTARHVAPPTDAVVNQRARARAAWVIVPKWTAGAPLSLEPTGRARMLAHLADSSFNYNLVGPAGFDRLAEIVDASECFKLTYSDLDDALECFEQLRRNSTKKSAGASREL
jgi:HprK-related kinase A